MKTIPQTLPKFFWHFCKQYKYRLASLISVSFLWALSMSLTPYSLKLIIDNMIQANLHLDDGYSGVWFAGFLYVFITFSMGIIMRFYDWSLIKMIPQMKCQITNEMFVYLEQRAYSYFHQNFAGSLANKINDIAKGVSTIVFFMIDQFLARALSFMIGSLTLFLVHPSFSWILIIWTVIFVTTSVKLSRMSEKFSTQYANSRSNVVGKIVDSISNILNVKLFAREDYEQRYLQKSLDDLVTDDCRLQWFLMKVKAFYAFSITVLTGSMIWLLINERSLGKITIGDAALILTLTSVLVRDIFQIANQLVAFSEEVGNCKQALSIISPQHEINTTCDGPPLVVTHGEIAYDNVNFQYHRKQDLFVNKSVTIQAGTKVGLVGFSGSGKTTFVNLILRFYSVDSGKISIDGQDIKNVTLESLREQIALIPQDLLLFHRTLMENIRYGRLDASDEEVIEYAKRAHCHDFIMKLNDGYHSMVGERGVKLSGGQRQRIAIARAMLKNAPILILDEATSSLDSATESLIQESLSRLMKGKTSVVIAHRLSTLFNMDRILVFNAGRIVEDGIHSELIQRNSHYKALWDMQVDGFIQDSEPDEKHQGKPSGMRGSRANHKRVAQLLKMSAKSAKSV